MPETTCQTKLLGLINRKARCAPSRRGWIVLFALAALGSWLTVLNIYPFLAPTKRVDTRILVVEGWVSLYVVEQAVGIFHQGSYGEVITCGCLMYENAAWRKGYSDADWAAERLRGSGLSDAPITPVGCDEARRDRTYHAALAVRRWLEENRSSVTAVDVLTTGPHARRSRLLFQKAFGSKIKVGIISIPDPEYDPDHWWRSSEGVRDVIGETIAYVYARFFFWPSPPTATLAPAAAQQ